jgi:hypothetical protein
LVRVEKQVFVFAYRSAAREDRIQLALGEDQVGVFIPTQRTVPVSISASDLVG